RGMAFAPRRPKKAPQDMYQKGLFCVKNKKSCNEKAFLCSLVAQNPRLRILGFISQNGIFPLENGRNIPFSDTKNAKSIH
ncbi:MAG: hypothetical protein K5945_01655, partial [Bacteroidaceae bacterium]|nr:hypothetical protein [Bacteroidaceae bacterium]